jgi:hypothetical protein
VLTCGVDAVSGSIAAAFELGGSGCLAKVFELLPYAAMAGPSRISVVSVLSFLFCVRGREDVAPQQRRGEDSGEKRMPLLAGPHLRAPRRAPAPVPHPCRARATPRPTAMSPMWMCHSLTPTPPSNSPTAIQGVPPIGRVACSVTNLSLRPCPIMATPCAPWLRRRGVRRGQPRDIK